MSDHERIAAERDWRNRRNPKRRVMMESQAAVDETGVIGEVAFAQYFGFPVNRIEREQPTGYNFLLADGTRVDVRSSRFRYAQLLVPPNVAKRNTIDVFVLCRIDTDTGKDIPRLLGWATLQEIRAAAIRKVSDNPNAIPAHAISPLDLHPMENLLRRHQMQTRRLFE